MFHTSNYRIATLAGSLALTVAALTAGCSLGGDPEQASTVLPSTEPATSTEATLAPPIPTVTAPVLPAAAKVNSVQGVRAFLPYLTQLLAYSYSSLDTRPLRQITGHYCAVCKQAVTEIDTAKRAGNTFRNATYRLTLVAPPADALNGEYDNIVQVQRGPRQQASPAGRVTKAYPGGKATWHVRMLWRGADWAVIDWDSS